VIPKIINRPDTASTDVPEQNRPLTTVPKAGVPDPEASKNAANPPLKEGVRPQAPIPPKADTEPDNTSITVSLLSVVGSPTTGIISFAGLALILLAAFALARRRERLASRQAHDIGSVSLSRARGQLVPATAPRRPSATTPPPPPSPPPPAQQSAAQRTPPAWVDRIPQTRAEALQMLGMGVSRDATETAMKKIVDGLRLSWHPDLAKDEADRQLREYRLKQINAAWDLIQGKRLERLDS
jgi:MYXO-CTERM domain-containing protein